MDGLMMDYPLTIEFILRRAETLFGHKAIVFEELGRALYAGPFFSTVALALPALLRARTLGKGRFRRVDRDACGRDGGGSTSGR